MSDELRDRVEQRRAMRPFDGSHYRISLIPYLLLRCHCEIFASGHTLLYSERSSLFVRATLYKISLRQYLLMQMLIL